MNLNEGQKLAYELMEAGENIFLSGEAGTGKSFVLNYYINNNVTKNIICCAPTGIAAININGSTIHRVFEIPIGAIAPENYNKNPSLALKFAEIIIIDEVSMCRLDVFEYIMKTIMTLPNKPQVIVVGDFFQLPPVITDSEHDALLQSWTESKFKSGYAFESEYWEKMKFKTVVLKEVVRQQEDLEFIKNLNYLRMGVSKCVEWFNKNAAKTEIDNAIYLCPENKEADEVNMTALGKLDTKEIIYQAISDGCVSADDMSVPGKLTLKVGARVILVVNNELQGYQNGSLGTIIKLENDMVTVRLDTGKLIYVKPYTWDILDYEVEDQNIIKKVIGSYTQMPIKLAYAITIHKSQGQTFDQANISPDCREKGQLYVALSRVKKIESIYLTKKIQRWNVQTDSNVKFFYRNNSN